MKILSHSILPDTEEPMWFNILTFYLDDGRKIQFYHEFLLYKTEIFKEVIEAGYGRDEWVALSAYIDEHKITHNSKRTI